MNNKYCLLSCAVVVVVDQEVGEDRDGDDDHCGIYYTHTHTYLIVYMSFTLRGSICFV